MSLTRVDHATFLGAVSRLLDDLGHDYLHNARHQAAALHHLDTWVRAWASHGPQSDDDPATWALFWEAMPPLLNWADGKKAWPLPHGETLQVLQRAYGAHFGSGLDLAHAVEWPWLVAAAARPGSAWQPDATGTDPVWEQLLTHLSAPHVAAWTQWVAQREPEVLERICVAPRKGGPSDTSQPLVYHQHHRPEWRSLWRQLGLNVERPSARFPSVLFAARDEQEVSELLAQGADPDRLNAEGLAFDRLYSQFGRPLHILKACHAHAQDARARLGRDTALPADRHAWDVWAYQDGELLPGTLAAGLAQQTYPLMTLDPGPPRGAMEWLARVAQRADARDVGFDQRWQRFEENLAQGYVSQAGPSGIPDWAMAQVATLSGHIEPPTGLELPVVDEDERAPFERPLKQAFHWYRTHEPTVQAELLVSWAKHVARHGWIIDAQTPAEAAQDDALAFQWLEQLAVCAGNAQTAVPLTTALKRMAWDASNTPFWQGIQALVVPTLEGKLTTNPWPLATWAAYLETPACALWERIVRIKAPDLAHLPAAMRREKALSERPVPLSPRPRPRS